MDLNADFQERVLLHSEDLPWLASPMPGVDRRMLDRMGDEVARATTIVRYAPNSHFSAHTHSGGEEFIVLEGVFQDEHGDYPAGTYVRNPPTSQHTPGSRDGCTIFVKLWQFDPDDRLQFRKDMSAALSPVSDGIAIAELHQDDHENVRLVALHENRSWRCADTGGCELLVLSGTFAVGGETLRQGSWLRLPDGDALDIASGQGGGRFWVKTGHLIHARPPASIG